MDFIPGKQGMLQPPLYLVSAVPPFLNFILFLYPVVDFGNSGIERGNPVVCGQRLFEIFVVNVAIRQHQQRLDIIGIDGDCFFGALRLVRA